MTSSLLILLLAQAPVSPPPLVNAEGAAAHAEVVAHDPETSGGARFAASFAGALLGTAIPAATIGLAAGLCRADDCTVWVTVAALAAAPFTVALGAWLGHHIAGGAGTYGKALAGAAIGFGVAAAAFYVVLLANKNGPDAVPAAAIGIALAGAFAITAAMLEYSHQAQLGALGLAIAPTWGGALVSVGGRF